MKQFFLFSAFLNIMLINVVNAQENPAMIIDSSGTGKSFTENMAEMIAPLDKSLITTGLLADKAFIFSSMEGFNGQNDSVISLARWKQFYRQLHNASILPNTLISPDSIISMAKGYLAQNIIPIAILNVKYNEFKPYALDSNLVQFSNGKLYDVPGRNQSPYNEKRLFVSTLLKDEIYQGQVNFRIDDNFYINNTPDTISSIEIDFGDGQGFRNISQGNKKIPNDNIIVNYSQIGLKTLTIKITFLNGNILQSISKFTIASTLSISPDATFTVSGLPYNGASGSGTAYVLYGCGNNNKLRKPIIVSDGFDPNNERHFNEIYNILNKENLVEKLISEGFDVVILDYNNGADYIQRNAFVLISLINLVNSQLTTNGSTSQLVVVGPSMAGLISRYALYYMEQNNMKHNTRLYISFDSPHLGANIPLGDQYWLNFFATYASAQGAIDGRNILNTPAAQQMLIYHYAFFPNTHPLRSSLISDPYFHFPSKCRKVAIANGSGGIGINFFNSCDQIINYVYHVNVLGDVVKGNAWAVPAPPNGWCKIFEGKIPTSFLGNIPIGYTKWEIKVKGTQPYDSAPGGSTDTNKKIADGDTQGKGDITTNYPTHCFIPTVSALAITGITTPFDAIFAPTSNQEHGLITLENIGWIRDEVSPIYLLLQNQSITDNALFEARNVVFTGRNINPYYQIGDFITEPNSVTNIRAGTDIIIRNGTHFKYGSEVHLYIDIFPCPSEFRLASNNTNENTGRNNLLFQENSSQNENNHPLELANNYENNISNSIMLYPNPTEGLFTLKVSEEYRDIEKTIIITDLLGKVIWQSKNNSHTETTINLSHHQKGIYFVKVITNNGMIMTKKLVVL